MTFSTNRHCLDYDSPGTIDNKCNKSDYSVDVDIDINLQILITQDLQFTSKITSLLSAFTSSTSRSSYTAKAGVGSSFGGQGKETNQFILLAISHHVFFKGRCCSYHFTRNELGSNCKMVVSTSVSALRLSYPSNTSRELKEPLEKLGKKRKKTL